MLDVILAPEEAHMTRFMDCLDDVLVCPLFDGHGGALLLQIVGEHLIGPVRAQFLDSRWRDSGKKEYAYHYCDYLEKVLE